MDRMLMGLIFLVVVSIFQHAVQPVLDVTPVAVPDSNELLERFRNLRTGMDSGEVEKILGPPDRSISSARGDGTILVWKMRWFLFPRETALVKLVGDRVAIASYASRNIADPVAWIEGIETRPCRSGRLPSIPGTILTEEKPWAALDAILEKLDRSWGPAPRVDPEAVERFDSPDLRPGTGGGRTTRHWVLGPSHLAITFEGEKPVLKRLGTPDLEIEVRDGYWRVRDRRNGLSVMEQL